VRSHRSRVPATRCRRGVAPHITVSRRRIARVWHRSPGCARRPVPGAGAEPRRGERASHRRLHDAQREREVPADARPLRSRGGRDGHGPPRRRCAQPRVVSRDHRADGRARNVPAATVGRTAPRHPCRPPLGSLAFAVKPGSGGARWMHPTAATSGSVKRTPVRMGDLAAKPLISCASSWSKTTR